MSYCTHPDKGLEYVEQLPDIDITNSKRHDCK